MNLDIVNEDGDPTKKNWDLSNKDVWDLRWFK